MHLVEYYLCSFLGKLPSKGRMDFSKLSEIRVVLPALICPGHELELGNP